MLALRDRRDVLIVTLAGALMGLLALLLPGQSASAAVAHRATTRTTQWPNHQYCLINRAGLCAAAKHPGVNSAIVMRANRDSRAQSLVFGAGRLRLGYPGLCIGGSPHLRDARSARCNGGHGIRWIKAEFAGRGVGFINVAATDADPHHVPQFLAAISDNIAGQIFIISGNRSLPHIFRDCFGNCGHPSAVSTVALTTTRPHFRWQYCLDNGRHVCMYALHRGVNSRIVLRPDRDVPAEHFSYAGGQLQFQGVHPFLCVGPNARTKRCGTTGTGWQEVVTPRDALKFWNVADTIGDPHRAAHWLTAAGIDSGFRVFVSADWRLLHKWRVCFGHCTRPAAAPRTLAAGATRLHPRDEVVGCSVAMKFRHPVIAGSTVRQPYAKLACTNRPDRFAAHLSLRKETQGVWHTIWTGRTSTKNPFPFHYYWHNLACETGTYQAVLTAKGTNSHGIAMTAPVRFRSVPRTVTNCVTANAVRITPDVGIFGGTGADCHVPTVYISRVTHPHAKPTFSYHGFLSCTDLPTDITSLMTFQQHVKRPEPHWELRHVSKTHDGLHHTATDLWTLPISNPPRKCSTGRFRSNWYSFGFSSTGDDDEGSFCSPVLRIASCAEGGNDRHLHGHERCPNPLTN